MPAAAENRWPVRSIQSAIGLLDRVPLSWLQLLMRIGVG